MRNTENVLAAIVGAALMFQATAPVAAQRGQRPAAPAVPAAPVSRTPDGQPDVNGFWGHDGYTLDLETGIADETTNQIQGLPPPDPSKQVSVVTDPPDGRIPYQPWAQERRVHLPTFKRGPTSEGNPTNERDVRPPTFCIVGMPHLNWFGDFLITQTPGYVVMQWEGAHPFRIIPLDATRQHPPSNVKLSMGDAIGHWEGNTLVVDTANINDWDWFDATGTFHSDAMTLVERFTFVDSKTMTYKATMTDPLVLTRPFTVTLQFRKRDRPADYELFEEACVEGTRGTDRLGFAIK
jgi:hypothetical protein